MLTISENNILIENTVDADCKQFVHISCTCYLTTATSGHLNWWVNAITFVQCNYWDCNCLQYLGFRQEKSQRLSTLVFSQFRICLFWNWLVNWLGMIRRRQLGQSTGYQLVWEVFMCLFLFFSSCFIVSILLNHLCIYPFVPFRKHPLKYKYIYNFVY